MRLANTYRLIRASLDARGLRAFVRNEGDSGEYRAALILLAILIGAATDASNIFRALIEAKGDDLASFVARVGDLSPEDEDATRRLNEVKEKLERVVKEASSPDELKPYQEWARRIGRYSFDSGRGFAEESPEQTTPALA